MYYWKLPPTPTIDLYNDMIQQTHLLIAGAAGSGKSCLLNGLIQTALHQPPDAAQFILIDYKGTELCEYEAAPHCMRYAQTAPDILRTLRDTIDLMERRLDYMRQHKQRIIEASDVYLIVDEMADLMTTHKRQAAPIIQRLTQLARACRIHVWLSTQCPLREIITTPIKCNIPARVALKTATRQDSRNIIDQSGAELLPDPQTEHRAQCLYRHGATTERWNLPQPNGQTKYLIDYWTKARKHFDGKRRTA